MASKLYTIDKSFDMHKLFHLIEHSKEGLDLIFMFGRDSTLYLNSSNLMILKALAKNSHRVLKFEVENNNHLDYIDAVNNENLAFNPTSIDLDDAESVQLEKSKKQFFKIPKLGFSFRKKNKSIQDVVFTEVEKGVGKFKLKFLMFVILFFLVLGVLATAFWALLFYVPTAKVKLFLNSETLINLIDVKARTDVQEVDAEAGIIPATTLDIEETETTTIDTTGEKEIGDYSTGEVTIYNKSSSKKKVKNNTAIKVKENDLTLSYLTTSEVEIPAKETMPFSTLPDGTTQPGESFVFGSQKVKVKAINFGPEYNIGKKKTFEINGFNKNDELYAENDDEIKGGSVDKVKSVTDADLRAVRKTLEDVLRAKSIEDLKKKVVDGQNLQEASITIDPVSEEYSHKLDEVTDKLTLKFTVKATGIAYSESNLKLAINELIKKVLPDKFSLANDDYDYEVAVLKDSVDPNTINLQVKLKSYVTPKIDEEKIKADLMGLSVDSAKVYLTDVKNVREFQIDIRPNLPAFLVSMPRKTENITIEIVR